MGTDSVTVRLLAFATAADAVGSGEQELRLAAGSTVGDLRRQLSERFPELEELWPRLAVALDGNLARADAEVPDGAEVALLPPVSGGSGGAPVLVDGPLDTDGVVSRVTAPSRGAVVTFLGTVRDHHAGRPVDHLLYTAYRPMAERAIRRIVAELEAGHDDLAAAIVHRLGEVPAGAVSVVIAVASPHRQAAYEASRTALERLKTEVAVWKREHYADGGAAWREEEPLAAAPGD